MTPAIRTAEKAGIAFTVHPYRHEPSAESFGSEAAEALGVAPERMFKTLVAQVDRSKLVLVLVPVAARLDLKALATALNAKKADLADPAAAERATGYIIGGISPLGGKKALPTLIDASALEFETIYVSAGRRGLQMELAPRDLIALTSSLPAPLATR